MVATNWCVVVQMLAARQAPPPLDPQALKCVFANGYCGFSCVLLCSVAVWQAQDSMAEPDSRPPQVTLERGQDGAAAATLSALPLDALTSCIPDWVPLDPLHVPRHRLTVERALFATSTAAARLPALATPHASLAAAPRLPGRPAAVPPALAGSQPGSRGGSGVAMDLVLARMAGNRTYSNAAGGPLQQGVGSGAKDVDRPEFTPSRPVVAAAAAGARSSFMTATEQFARDVRDGKERPDPSVGSGQGRPVKRGGGGLSRSSGSRSRKADDSDAARPIRPDSLAAMDPEDLPEQLRNLEPRMIEMIENEIMNAGEPIAFEDIGKCMMRLVWFTWLLTNVQVSHW